MTNETLYRHKRSLARATSTTIEAVEAVTDHMAQRLVEAAERATKRCPDEHDWLEVAMACNAASNKHARAIIEHKARALWAARQTCNPKEHGV